MQHQQAQQQQPEHSGQQQQAAPQQTPNDARQPQAQAQPRLHIVLFEPQIPQNTGNVGRLCAITRSRLHLIHPLGFTITDSHLKRSGMDYWYSLDIRHHANWHAFDASADSPAAPRRWLLTTKADRSLWDADFAEGDAIIFGNEGHGSPDWLHAAVAPERRIAIPQFDPALRSLNLSTAAGIAAYEALRQITRR